MKFIEQGTRDVSKALSLVIDGLLKLAPALYNLKMNQMDSKITIEEFLLTRLLEIT